MWDNHKVVVFSYFSDTVHWLRNQVQIMLNSDGQLTDFRDRMTFLTGSEGNDEEVLFGFAPRSSEAPPSRATDRFDLLVATDVLAEGVNFQQARHIVNYDLPWNPMRLVQRHGRVDRIGSQHSRVFLRC